MTVKPCNNDKPKNFILVNLREIINATNEHLLIKKLTKRFEFYKEVLKCGSGSITKGQCTKSHSGTIAHILYFGTSNETTNRDMIILSQKADCNLDKHLI